MNIIPTWRWFGPDDPISLKEIRQTGAKGIVTALHHLPNGAEWSIDEIAKRQATIADAGLTWTVVESLPVHEDIKKGGGEKYLSNYKRSLENLGECGLTCVCYNFMPALDWSRTDLNFKHPDGTTGLRFDIIAIAAFDMFILKRQGARESYPVTIVEQAICLFENLSFKGIEKLTANILAGLPGTEEHFDLSTFRLALTAYADIGHSQLRKNLERFLVAVLPAAEQAGIFLCIHPDDPPFSLFGLPRIVSTERDLEEIYAAYESLNNGLTFCTGSLGAVEENDLSAMFRKFADRVHFLHLRNVKKEGEHIFHESGHLEGDVDMAELVALIMQEQKRRETAGRPDVDIPYRPDHGLAMLNDLIPPTNPGYSLTGRLRGIAEIQGLIAGLKRIFYK